MVSNYSDAGQERWLAGKGIDLLRGTGRLAGPGVVEVDGVRHTARDVVLATGADPVMPPVPGLRELDGVWTNREVTGMKAVPRRLLILGGGPVGRRDGPGRAPPRRRGGPGRGRGARAGPRARAAGRGARRGAAPRRRRADPRRARDRRAARRRRLRPGPGRRPRAARRPPARRHRPAPAVARVGLDTVGVTAEPHGVPVDAHLRAGGPAVGHRRRHRHPAADPRRQVPGRGRRLEHPRRAPRGQLRGHPGRRLHRPAGGRRRRQPRPRSARPSR